MNKKTQLNAVDHTKDPIWSIVGMVKTGPRTNIGTHKHTYLYGTEEQIAELEKAEMVRDRPRRKHAGRPLR